MRPIAKSFCLAAFLLVNITGPVNAQSMSEAIEKIVANIDEAGAEHVRERPVFIISGCFGHVPRMATILRSADCESSMDCENLDTRRERPKPARDDPGQFEKTEIAQPDQ